MAARFHRTGYVKIRNFRPSNLIPCVNTILEFISSEVTLKKALELTLESTFCTLFEQDVSLLNFIIYAIRRTMNLNIKPNDAKKVWEACSNILNYIDSKNNRDFSSKAGKYKSYLREMDYRSRWIPEDVRQKYMIHYDPL